MSTGARPPHPGGIEEFIHCAQCVEEWKSSAYTRKTQSPQEYQKIEAGWTEKGLRIWCVRHNRNVMHLDFEGRKVKTAP